jgi:glycerophosphoryl diester phosphodiesterase
MLGDAIRVAERVAARALHLRKDGASAAALAAARAAGLSVLLWTVNDPAELARVAGPGVDGIFTDFPERFLHTTGGE